MFPLLSALFSPACQSSSLWRGDEKCAHKHTLWLLPLHTRGVRWVQVSFCLFLRIEGRKQKVIFDWIKITERAFKIGGVDHVAVVHVIG